MKFETNEISCGRSIDNLTLTRRREGRLLVRQGEETAAGRHPPLLPVRHQHREGEEPEHAGVQVGPLEARQQFGEEEHDDPLPAEDVVLLHAGGGQGPHHQGLLRTPLQGRVEAALRLLQDGRRRPQACLPV